MHAIVRIAATLLSAPSNKGNAQSAVPTRTLSAPEVVSAVSFGGIESVRALNKNGLLVNDSRKRQLIVLDSSLNNPATLLDSATNNRTHYGAGDAALIPYLADSTLFRDVNTKKYFVIDPEGIIDHRLERAKPGEEPLPLNQPRGFDLLGNAIMMGIPRMTSMRMSSKRPPTFLSELVRVNYATHEYESLVEISPPRGDQAQLRVDDKGNRQAKRIINPIPVGDDWAVLSDGTLAVVRFDGYRVDMINVDNKKRQSLKLSYSKRKLSDDDKRSLIDSINAALTQDATDPRSQASLMAASMGSVLAVADSVRKSGGGFGTFRVEVDQANSPLTTFEFPALRDIRDELPPFRIGQLKADYDASLWIPTNNVSPSDARETIYDVVNSKGALVQRVRVPAGRTIVGFARGGIVYLKFERALNDWVVERTHVVN